MRSQHIHFIALSNIALSYCLGLGYPRKCSKPYFGLKMIEVEAVGTPQRVSHGFNGLRIRSKCQGGSLVSGSVRKPTRPGNLAGLLHIPILQDNEIYRNEPGTFRLLRVSLYRNHALKLKSIKCLRRCLRFSRDSAAISVLKLNIYPQLSVVFMAPPFRAGGYFHFSPIRSLNLGCSISPSSSYERNILISSISAISSFSRNIVAGL